MAEQMCGVLKKGYKMLITVSIEVYTYLELCPMHSFFISFIHHLLIPIILNS